LVLTSEETAKQNQHTVLTRYGNCSLEIRKKLVNTNDCLPYEIKIFDTAIKDLLGAENLK